MLSGLFTLSASLIWGINTLFLLNAGLSIFEVFIANAAFTAAMALLEIPTGVIADTRGRRASFLLSEATLAVGTLAYVGVGVRVWRFVAATGIEAGAVLRDVSGLADDGTAISVSGRWFSGTVGIGWGG